MALMFIVICVDKKYLFTEKCDIVDRNEILSMSYHGNLHDFYKK